MDNNTLAQAGGITGMLTFVLMFCKLVYDKINHTHVRSNCCGKKLEASLDVDTSTPPLAPV